MLYPVYETFYTFQGEGCFSGHAAFFIRLYGCPQKCFWCDSAGTWHPDYRPSQVEMMTVDRLAEIVRRESPDGSIIVVTGGEPILFNLEPLCDALHQMGRRVHLETSGIAKLRGNVDWLTLSPKSFGMDALSEVVKQANEVKIIVHEPADLEKGLSSLTDINKNATVWLHPEWSKAREGDGEILRLITEFVKSNPGYRAGYQIHKLYKSDELDSGSIKTQIPLGGNPQLGI